MSLWGPRKSLIFGESGGRSCFVDLEDRYRPSQPPCRTRSERIFGGLYFINREDRRYNKLKKMTYASILLLFTTFYYFLLLSTVFILFSPRNLHTSKIFRTFASDLEDRPLHCAFLSHRCDNQPQKPTQVP